jgi:hypothetical protein
VRRGTCAGSKPLRRSGRVERVEQESVVGETRIPLAALGVEDPQDRPTPRRAVAVVGDERLGPLPDHVPAETDPRPASQFEPDAGRLVDRGREAAGRPGRIEDQEQRLRSPRSCGESMEAIGDLRRRVGLRQATPGQVDDEQVDRAAGDQAAGDAQALVQAGRGDDHEPFEADAAGDGLDRVEAAREVEPGDDRTLGLGFRGDPQAEGRPSARAQPADRDTGRRREPTRSEDRVERGEASVDDPVIGSGVVPWLAVVRRARHQGQRTGDPRSCGTPASPQARDGGVHITSTGRHRTSRVEQMF